MKRRLITGVSCVALCLLSARESLAAQLSAADLLDLLRARVDSVQSITADVTETIGAGDDCEEYYQGWMRFFDLAKVERPETYSADEVAERRVRDNFNRGRPAPPIINHYHYTWSSPGFLRIDLLDAELLPTGRSHNFDGRNWSVYNFRTMDVAGARRPSLSVGDYVSDPFYFLEFAQGTSITTPITPAHPADLDVGFTLAPDSIVRMSITWSDLLDVVDLQTATLEEQPRPRTGEVMPSVRVRGPEVDFYFGRASLFELLLWFDPEQDYQLCAAQYSRVEPFGDLSGNAEITYPPVFQLIWSDPEIVDGDFRYNNCRIGMFDTMGLPGSENQRQHLVTAETWAYEYQFRDYVRGQEALDASEFEPDPPSGTNVVDELQGIRYLVGDMGEAIDVTALQRGQVFENQGPLGRWERWRILLMVGTLLAIVVYLVVVIQRRGKRA